MKKLLGLCLIVALLGGAFWFYQSQHKPDVAAAAPSFAVQSVLAQRQDVPVSLEANGTVTPVNTVDVRAQTSSTIRQVLIKEGQFVKVGQVMFTLDERTDLANLQKAQAQLARDQATQADLERQLKRSQELVAKNFLSQSAVDTVQSQFDAQRAALQSDVAAIAAAQAALSYNQIRAPFAGRAGAINVYPGSLVTPAGNPLVTITQLNPITVAFNVPEANLQALLAASKAGEVKVTVVPANGAAPLNGQLNFIDNAVDSTQGTVRAKAVFDNAAQQLWPGQYVTLRVTVDTLKDAVVVPQAAVITNANGRLIYVVESKDGKDVAAIRPVKVLYSYGNSAAVSGLNGGEKVVVDGKQNLRPGVQVREARAGEGGAAPGKEPGKAPGTEAGKEPAMGAGKDAAKDATKDATKGAAQ
jgi:RND family efflux transporter MFP subunit